LSLDDGPAALVRASIVGVGFLDRLHRGLPALPAGSLGCAHDRATDAGMRDPAAAAQPRQERGTRRHRRDSRATTPPRQQETMIE
jgi:hypothetical protein